MKKYDVMVIGELNVDLILNNLHDFPEIGKEIIADDMHLALGSSSAIFASNLSTMGTSVAFLGIVGNDNFGNIVLNALNQRQVSTEYIIRHTKYKTGATIALNYGENRAMVTFPGAMEHLKASDITGQILQECTHLHISSVFLQPGIKYYLRQIFQLARETGLTTSLDTQWDPQEKWDLDLQKILPFVDVFFPNQAELLALTGTRNVDAALKKISPSHNIVAVKMGREGSLGFRNERKYLAEPFINLEIVDAIGAGDSFNAGFIHKFLQDSELDQCLQFGNLLGAINTTAAGGTAAFADLEKVKKTALDKFGYEIES
jgi:sugar/nucleoside kinase (ribokinase family)